jgi:hypothetical protein
MMIRLLLAPGLHGRRKPTCNLQTQNGNKLKLEENYTGRNGAE